MGQFGTGIFNLGTNLFDSTVDLFDYMNQVKIERNKRVAQEVTKAADQARADAQEVEVRKYNSPANQVKMLKEAGINPWNKVSFIQGDRAELMTGMYDMNTADLQTETLKREPITLEQVAQAQGIETAELNNDYLRLKNYGQVLQNDQTLAQTNQIKQNIEFMNSPWFVKMIMKIFGFKTSDLIPKGLVPNQKEGETFKQYIDRTDKELEQKAREKYGY